MGLARPYIRWRVLGRSLDYEERGQNQWEKQDVKVRCL
jgi:hypothetical protein